MRWKSTRIRTCWAAGQTPDAVIALDALNATFGALKQKPRLARRRQQRSVGLHGTVVLGRGLADLCGDACEGMMRTVLRCPAFRGPIRRTIPGPELNEFHDNWVPNEPEDILTYGPTAITSGIALWLTMTGPDLLPREVFASTTVSSLDNWSSGIGPVITISEDDHYGAKSVWIIRYTGNSNDPFFDDVTGDFITLDEVKVPEELTRI